MNKQQANSLQPERVSADMGNAGNILYGQFSLSAVDGVRSFVEWLNQQGHAYGRILSKWGPGSREFSAAWMYLGTNDPQGFHELQAVFYSDARTFAS
jgi:hypothetical protein